MPPRGHDRQLLRARRPQLREAGGASARSLSSPGSRNARVEVKRFDPWVQRPAPRVECLAPEVKRSDPPNPFSLCPNLFGNRPWERSTWGTAAAGSASGLQRRSASKSKSRGRSRAASHCSQTARVTSRPKWSTGASRGPTRTGGVCRCRRSRASAEAEAADQLFSGREIRTLSPLTVITAPLLPPIDQKSRVVLCRLVCSGSSCRFQPSQDRLDEKEKVVKVLARDFLHDGGINDLVAMDEDVPKSHHPIERGSELLGKPAVANQEL